MRYTLHPLPRLALAMVLCCAFLGWGAAQAAATRTISSARYGYSFVYPASWTAAPAGTTSFDALVRSPDGATSFAVQVNGGELTAAAARTLGLGLLHSALGVPQSTKLATTSSAPALPGGMAIQVEGRGVSNGQHRVAIVRVGEYEGFSLVFLGAGPTPPSIQVDAPVTALRGILASVRMRTVRAHYTAPAAHFGLYYPLGWRRVSYPALGKIVLDGPGGAVIFADFGHGASNAVDLRLLLLDNASLMGKLSSQSPASFSPSLIVDGSAAQLVQVPLVDKLGRTLNGIIADTSLNGYNYVFGGAAPKGSAAEKQVVDAITSATVRPPRLPPDTGAFATYSNAAHHYQISSPAAWVTTEHAPSADASFTSRDGNLTMTTLVRTGAVGAVLNSLTHTLTQGLTINKQTTTPVTLGTLPGQERVLQATIVPKLVEEIHLIAAASGARVYVLSWNFYVGVPDAAALQQLARRSQASFTVTG